MKEKAKIDNEEELEKLCHTQGRYVSGDDEEEKEN